MLTEINEIQYEEKSPTTFFNLPFEDIIEGNIFIYLSVNDLLNLYLVSKHMREFVKLLLKRKTKLILNDCNINESQFKILIDCCENLQDVNLSGVKWITDEYSRPLFEKNTNLININLASCRNLTLDGVKPFIINCKNLQHLEVMSCEFVTKEFLFLLSEYNPFLQYVNIMGCNVFDLDDAVLIFKKKQKHLKTFLYSVITIFPPFRRLENFCSEDMGLNYSYSYN